MANSLFGWGGIRIKSSGTEYVEFSNAFGNIRFIREDVRNTTISGTVIVHPKGWRPVIEMEIFNMTAADVLQWQTLMFILSDSQLNNRTMLVYPRHNNSDAGSVLYYNCFLDGDIEPQDIANVNVGQSMSLRFIGKDLITNLPTNYSGQIAKDIFDGTDTYWDGTDTYELF